MCQLKVKYVWIGKFLPGDILRVADVLAQYKRATLPYVTLI